MRWRIPWIASLLGIGLITTLPFWNAKGDDVYITYRYVINFVEHGQLAYNLGEPTYGITSPLWFGLQSLLYMILRNMYVSSWILCLVSLVGCITALWLLAEQMIRSNWLRFFAVVMLLIDPWFMRWAFSGQEIAFKIGMVALLIWFTCKTVKSSGGTWKTSLLTGALFAAGLLTRPEMGLLILILLGALLYFRQYKRVLIIGSVFVILYGIWAVFCHFQFGELLPHTILVKTTSLRETLSIGQKISRLFSFSIPRYGAIVISPVVALFVIAFMISVKRIKSISSALYDPCVTAIAMLWVVGVTAGYLISGAYMAAYYTLIFSPFIPFILFAAIEAFACSPNYHFRKYVLASVGWAVLWSVGLLTWGGLGSFSWLASSNYNQGDDAAYIEYARWIDHNLPENARIATAELGIVGYYGKRYMIDLAGIATPSMLHNQNENLIKLKPTYFSLYGPPVDYYGPFKLQPIRIASFLRIGGGNAMRGKKAVCTLYQVVGMSE
jgi:arabinofuranosyltransferase